MKLRLISLYLIDRDVGLEQVIEFPQRVEFTMSRMVESWKTGSNGFIMERKRVDSIDNVLELQIQSILTLQ